MRYVDDRERYAAIRAGAVSRLRAGGPDLAGLEGEALVRKLTEEALAAYYDDQVAANYSWDFVEREVRRAIAEA
ncbi:hypothetical protein ACQHIV_37925 [Kribbella sp. GL6]|uniref:hypothetical protein n=1 Tax=Kribbella sp. GL6 TaxID=3419765 RepID=UPI003CFD0F94